MIYRFNAVSDRNLNILLLAVCGVSMIMYTYVFMSHMCRGQKKAFRNWFSLSIIGYGAQTQVIVLEGKHFSPFASFCHPSI